MSKHYPNSRLSSLFASPTGEVLNRIDDSDFKSLSDNPDDMDWDSDEEVDSYGEVDSLDLPDITFPTRPVNIEVLKYKKELLCVLLSITELEIFINGFCMLNIVSDSSFYSLSSLNYDLVDKYLIVKKNLNKIPDHLTHNQWKAFLDLLSQFESSALLSLAIEIGMQEQDESGYARAREITFSDCHVPVLASILSECSHKWEEVGIMLFLPEHIIAECKNGSSNAIKFCNILQAWIRQNKKLVNMHTVGQSLREKNSANLGD